MKRIFIIFCLIFITISGFTDKVLEYRMTEGDKVTITRFGIKRISGGHVITSAHENGESSCTVDSAYRCLDWYHTNLSENSRVRGVRTGNVIKLTGMFRGNTINKELRINDGPWYQTMELSLEKFISQQKEKITFWVIQAGDMQLYEMEASKKGIETIKYRGQDTKALHITVNLTGLAALFWHADFWFRLGDFRYIKYESIHGPGAPLATIELISERKEE